MSKPHQPASLARLKGQEANHSRDRASNLSAGIEGGRPTRPGHLSKTAKKEWNRVVKLLLQRGTLTKADASILEVYVQTYDQQRECLDEIAKSGSFETDLDGFRCETAAAKRSLKLGIQLRALLVQLGLTPAAREKAKRVAPAKPKEVYEPGSVGWLLSQRAEDLAAMDDAEPVEEPTPEEEAANLAAALKEMDENL